MDDNVHTVDGCWLPKRWQSLVWTDFEDPSLIEVGTIFFDPHSYAHYAGIVTHIDDRGFVTIRWNKGVDNMIDDHKTRGQIERAGYYWADPCMQEEI